MIKMTQISARMLERQVKISSDNKGPLVNIAAWLGMTVMILCVATRLGSKFVVVRRWTIDDTIIMTTMVLATAHTVTLSYMVTNGLGQRQATLSDEQVVLFQKYGYSSQLVYIPVLCLGKLSTLVYLKSLSPTSLYTTLNHVCKIVVALWAVSAEVAIAFQCSLPDTWAINSTTKCFNRIAFWNTIGVFDILTDLAIVFLPAYLVWTLQMPRTKKVMVFLAFGVRVFIIPITILRLYHTSTSSNPSLPDQTFSAYQHYLISSIQINFAIFAACVPFLKPFVESMSSGAHGATVRPMDSSYAPGSKFSTLLSGISNRKGAAPRPPKGSIRMDSLPGSRIDHNETLSKISVDEVHRPHQRQKTSDSGESDEFHFGITSDASGGRQGRSGSVAFTGPQQEVHSNHIRRATPEENEARSSLGSDKMIIKRTTEWTVQEEYDQGVGAREGNGSEHGSGRKDWARKPGHYAV